MDGMDVDMDMDMDMADMYAHAGYEL